MRNPAAAKQPEPPPNRLAAGGAPSDELGYAYFLRAVRRLTGVNLEHYRQGQLRRRLDALLQRVGARGYLEYARLLERDPARLQEFRDYFTINVTEFFRDPDRFRYLEQRVLPELLRGRAGLNVWSAACSTGAEPYSVAILLRELAPRGPHRILATDVDRTVLARAQRGADYGPSELRNVSPERLARHFRPGPDGQTWAVCPEIRALVEVREHNLLDLAPRGRFDLILCRNVVIYFTEEAKRGLYERLAGALRPGGVLFVGGTEVVSAAHELGLVPCGPSFYRRDTAEHALPRLVRAGLTR
ncbi:MAG TPA: protein-glutamate O-methyltransferase CheR [Chloroflexota bacterium]|jgi:chemotaxis protein methyltransferase CheR|nr:protein-glutamate O-methyltransferase CheR [Chloroflexota bacterium]